MIDNYDNNANYISIIVWNKNDSNILTPNSLASVYALEQIFNQYSITVDNKQYKYTDFCARDYIDSPVICLFLSSFVYIFVFNSISLFYRFATTYIQNNDHTIIFSTDLYFQHKQLFLFIQI